MVLRWLHLVRQIGLLVAPTVLLGLLLYDYKKNKNTHLLINGIDVSAVCYRLRIMTKYIILKAPLNFHLIDFKHKIHVYQQKDTTYKITIKRPILFKKMMIIVLHIQPNRVLNN